jgi:hypothetical protein
MIPHLNELKVNLTETVMYIELDEPCLLRKGSGIYHKYLLLWLDALDL